MLIDIESFLLFIDREIKREYLVISSYWMYNIIGVCLFFFDFVFWKVVIILEIGESVCFVYLGKFIKYF